MNHVIISKMVSNQTYDIYLFTSVAIVSCLFAGFLLKFSYRTIWRQISHVLHIYPYLCLAIICRILPLVSIYLSYIFTDTNDIGFINQITLEICISSTLVSLMLIQISLYYCDTNIINPKISNWLVHCSIANILYLCGLFISLTQSWAVFVKPLSSDFKLSWLGQLSNLLALPFIILHAWAASKWLIF